MNGWMLTLTAARSTAVAADWAGTAGSGVPAEGIDLTIGAAQLAEKKRGRSSTITAKRPASRAEDRRAIIGKDPFVRNPEPRYLE